MLSKLKSIINNISHPFHEFVVSLSSSFSNRLCIHCVRRSAIAGPFFQEQLDCLIAITILCSMVVCFLVCFLCLLYCGWSCGWYAITSEFPQCGINKVYQIKSNVILSGLKNSQYASNMHANKQLVNSE